VISLSKWQPRLHAPEIDMMKERFAKLLLGEDSSGKGVCIRIQKFH
jgi:hypothetical protein